ncbi:hypothetical protein MLD38_009664 [Melastoma candidum]|uniref:Uncharacterized protein n=1 Tax=Melastoma candidum TaxID=119954 RepID=A0ACB9RYT9_9MYRT|nr:hypothetical protein MLD38_009664 [Melastoma candidum]
MDSHHASLGRRTLEEIRQKRAAEKLSKASSGPDLAKVSPSPAPPVGMKKSESANRLSESDVSNLVSQIKELLRVSADLQSERDNLSSRLEEKVAENESLCKRLNDLEQNTVPSLRKALKEVAIEKDAAVVAREDYATQLRMIKKRLKEAEEEQYRAEEDAAALRAELNSVQQQAANTQFGGVTSMGSHLDQVQALEKEVSNLKVEIQQERSLRQVERQRYIDEQARAATLMSERQALEEQRTALSRESSEKPIEKPIPEKLSAEDKDRLERQLHDMAVVVERLESSRQKLLTEIDSQSSEIERLFEENTSLASSCHEAANTAILWEKQVKDCLKQNEELRGVINRLRTEQVSPPSNNGQELKGAQEARRDVSNQMTTSAYSSDVLFLKEELLKEQSRAEALSAEVTQLSVHLQQTTQAYNSLARLYKPVLRNIESSLIKMKDS